MGMLTGPEDLGARRMHCSRLRGSPLDTYAAGRSAAITSSVSLHSIAGGGRGIAIAWRRLGSKFHDPAFCLSIDLDIALGGAER